MSIQDHEAIFSAIWANNSWADPDSRSGPGSSLRQTAWLRQELAQLLQELRPKLLLDIPCGDFRWMGAVPLPPGVEYVGGDIVASLIAANQAQYARPGISFRRLDLLRDPLPRADLVLCRDGLVHFSLADIHRAIANLKRSGATNLLATHFTGNRANIDVRTPDWQPLSLTSAPFFFPQPLRLIDERCPHEDGRWSDKCLGLWRLEDIPGPPDV